MENCFIHPHFTFIHLKHPFWSFLFENNFLKFNLFGCRTTVREKRSRNGGKKTRDTDEDSDSNYPFGGRKVL